MNDNEIQNILDSLSPEQLLEVQRQAEAYNKLRDNGLIYVYEPNFTADQFHKSEIPIKWLFGGNMSGKTYALCKEVCCHLLEEDPSGTTPDRDYRRHYLFRHQPKMVWLGSVTTEKVISIYRQNILQMLPKGFVVRSDNIYHTYYMKNGNVLQLKSYDSSIETWQSDPVDFIALDEQPPFLHFKEAKSRVNRKNGRIACAMTPLYANSAWTFREIYQNRSKNPNYGFWIMDLMENVHLDPESLKRQIADFTGTEEEEARLHGKFMILAGIIHPTFQEERHVIKSFEIDDDMKREFIFVRTIDLHQRSENVCQWFMLKPDSGKIKSNLPAGVPNDGPLIIQFQEFKTNPYLLSQFADEIKDRSKFLEIKYNIWDSADTETEMHNGTGLKSELIKKGISGINANRSHGAGYQRLNEYLDAGRFFIFEDCRDTINSLQYHIWDNFRGSKKDEVELKENWVHKDDHQVRNCHYIILNMPPLNWARQEMQERMRHGNPDKIKEDYRIDYRGKGQNRNYQSWNKK